MFLWGWSWTVRAGHTSPPRTMTSGRDSTGSGQPCWVWVMEILNTGPPRQPPPSSPGWAWCPGWTPSSSRWRQPAATSSPPRVTSTSSTTTPDWSSLISTGQLPSKTLTMFDKFYLKYFQIQYPWLSPASAGSVRLETWWGGGAVQQDSWAGLHHHLPHQQGHWTVRHHQAIYQLNNRESIHNAQGTDM